MESSDITKRIQQLNSIFSKSRTTFIPLKELCAQLCSIIDCNIYIFKPDGNFLAYSVSPYFKCPYTECSLAKEKLPCYYLDLYNASDAPVIRRYEEVPFCTYENVRVCIFKERYCALYPIFINFRKSAGMLLIRYGSDFTQSDLVLCEYMCAIISLELLRKEWDSVRVNELQITSARLAVGTLSPGEQKAALAILDELSGTEGTIFLNAIASKIYLTQSTVTSALKKLEGAGCISTKGKGVKGKYIKVANNYLHNELHLAVQRRVRSESGTEA